MSSVSLLNTITWWQICCRFHTLVTMTKDLQQLLEEGHTVDMEALSTLSPYRTKHINRFGNYVINPDRMPEPLEQHLGFSLWPVSTWFGDLCVFYPNPYRHPFR